MGELRRCMGLPNPEDFKKTPAPIQLDSWREEVFLYRWEEIAGYLIDAAFGRVLRLHIFGRGAW